MSSLALSLFSLLLSVSLCLSLLLSLFPPLFSHFPHSLSISLAPTLPISLSLSHSCLPLIPPGVSREEAVTIFLEGDPFALLLASFSPSVMADRDTLHACMYLSTFVATVQVCVQLCGEKNKEGGRAGASDPTAMETDSGEQAAAVGM